MKRYRTVKNTRRRNKKLKQRRRKTHKGGMLSRVAATAARRAGVALERLGGPPASIFGRGIGSTSKPPGPGGLGGLGGPARAAAPSAASVAARSVASPLGPTGSRLASLPRGALPARLPPCSSSPRKKIYY